MADQDVKKAIVSTFHVVKDRVKYKHEKNGGVNKDLSQISKDEKYNT